MEKKTLSLEQIDQLYLFTRQHFVEWYDLQSELVDHLANAIETEWQENPKLSFDEALKVQFKKFGIFGFTGVIEERQKGLTKKYNALFWSYYKEFFKLPKIILTLFSIYLLYKFFAFFEKPEYVFVTLLISILGISAIIFIKKTKELERKEKQTLKKWLFEEVAVKMKANSSFIISVTLFNISVQVINHHNYWQNEYIPYASILLVLISLFVYIQLKIIPQKVSEELAKTYPEYQLEIV